MESIRGVYVIECNEEGFFYVGSSTNIPRRVMQHREGNGSAFCKAHGGVKRQVVPLTRRNERLELWEQAETVHRMVRYGFNKVRGWIFARCAPLDSTEAEFVKMIVCGTYSLCYTCGRQGHFASKCTEKTMVRWLGTLTDVNE